MRPFLVLVGIDGSPASLHALRYALRVCEEAGADAKLHLCAGAAASVAGGMLEQAEAEARAANRSVSRELLRGDAAELLAGRAAALHADLIVVGTHRERGEWLRGSLASHLLEHASCPVVLARQG